MFLQVFSFIYGAFWISVEAEDVVEVVIVITTSTSVEAEDVVEVVITITTSTTSSASTDIQNAP